MSLLTRFYTWLFPKRVIPPIPRQKQTVEGKVTGVSFVCVGSGYTSNTVQVDPAPASKYVTLFRCPVCGELLCHVWHPHEAMTDDAKRNISIHFKSRHALTNPKCTTEPRWEWALTTTRQKENHG